MDNKYYAIFDKSTLQCVAVDYCLPEQEIHLNNPGSALLAIEIQDTIIRKEGVSILSQYKITYVDDKTIKVELRRETMTVSDLESMSADSEYAKNISFNDLQIAIISNMPDDYILPTHVIRMLENALKYDRATFSAALLFPKCFDNDKCMFHWDHIEIDDSGKVKKKPDGTKEINRYYILADAESGTKFVLAFLFSAAQKYKKVRFVSAYRKDADGVLKKGGFHAIDAEYKELCIKLGIFISKYYTDYFKACAAINWDVKTVADLKTIEAPDYEAIYDKSPHKHTGRLSGVVNSISGFFGGSAGIEVEEETSADYIIPDDVSVYKGLQKQLK